MNRYETGQIPSYKALVKVYPERNFALFPKMKVSAFESWKKYKFLMKNWSGKGRNIPGTVGQGPETVGNHRKPSETVGNHWKPSETFGKRQESLEIRRKFQLGGSSNRAANSANRANRAKAPTGVGWANQGRLLAGNQDRHAPLKKRRRGCYQRIFPTTFMFWVSFSSSLRMPKQNSTKKAFPSGLCHQKRGCNYSYSPKQIAHIVGLLKPGRLQGKDWVDKRLKASCRSASCLAVQLAAWPFS